MPQFVAGGQRSLASEQPPDREADGEDHEHLRSATDAPRARVHANISPPCLTADWLWRRFRWTRPCIADWAMLLVHRMFIRLALLFLLAGIGLGFLLQVRKGFGLAPLPYAAVTVHNHLLTVGFMLNMVMGVAHWMFPRLPGATAVKAARDPLAWANLTCLNVGLVLRAASEPWHGQGLPAGLVLSAILQLAGVVLFVLAIWSRVRFSTARQPPATER
jgi:hypothetical protein